VRHLYFSCAVFKTMAESVGFSAGQTCIFLNLRQLACKDSPASSERTRKLLVWQPRQTGLIADLDAAQYFEPGTDRAVAAR
jgi:hypothetical protein